MPTYDAERLFPCFVESLKCSVYDMPKVLVLRHRNDRLDPEAADRYDRLLAGIIAEHESFSIQWIDGEFNYSSMINHATGQLSPDTELVCLANDDIVFASEKWLDSMVKVLDDNPGAAIVGCRLLHPLDPNTEPERLVRDPVSHYGTVQHAGVSIVQEKGTTLIHKGRPHDYFAVSRDRSVDAVTFALVLIRRSLFNEQCFDVNLDWDFNDADFCLQAVARGYQIRYCASSIHFHLETATRRKYGLYGKNENKKYFMQKWHGRIARAMSLDAFTAMEPYHC